MTERASKISVTWSPSRHLVWTQWAGGHVENLTASSRQPDLSSSWGLQPIRGENRGHVTRCRVLIGHLELMEKPPTVASPGMKKSSHWPALKLGLASPSATFSVSPFTVGERFVMETTLAATAPGSWNTDFIPHAAHAKLKLLPDIDHLLVLNVPFLTL